MTLPHYANIRDGELVKQPLRFGPRGLVAAVALTFTLTVVFLADPMNAVSDKHPDCYEVRC